MLSQMKLRTAHISMISVSYDGYPQNADFIKSMVLNDCNNRKWRKVPNETRPYIDESVSYDGYMIGFVALIGAYATTGQIIPGVF